MNARLVQQSIHGGPHKLQRSFLWAVDFHPCAGKQMGNFIEPVIPFA